MFESPKEKNTFYSRSVALNLDVIRDIELCVSLKEQNRKLNHIPLDTLEWDLLSWMMFAWGHEQQYNMHQSSPNQTFLPLAYLWPNWFPLKVNRFCTEKQKSWYKCFLTNQRNQKKTLYSVGVFNSCKFKETRFTEKGKILNRPIQTFWEKTDFWTHHPFPHQSSTNIKTYFIFNELH